MLLIKWYYDSLLSPFPFFVWDDYIIFFLIYLTYFLHFILLLSNIYIYFLLLWSLIYEGIISMHSSQANFNFFCIFLKIRLSSSEECFKLFSCLSFSTSLFASMTSYDYQCAHTLSHLYAMKSQTTNNWHDFMLSMRLAYTPSRLQAYNNHQWRLSLVFSPPPSSSRFRFKAHLFMKSHLKLNGFFLKKKTFLSVGKWEV